MPADCVCKAIDGEEGAECSVQMVPSHNRFNFPSCGSRYQPGGGEAFVLVAPIPSLTDPLVSQLGLLWSGFRRRLLLPVRLSMALPSASERVVE